MKGMVAGLALLVWGTGAGAAAAQDWDNEACDAACGQPCFFGSCTPAKSGYEQALAQCDIRRLELVGELYAGTRHAQLATEAARTLRAQGLARIRATPNGCAGVIPSTAMTTTETAPDLCAQIDIPAGWRCAMRGGRATLIPPATAEDAPLPEVTDPPSSTVPASASPLTAAEVAQERYACTLPDGEQGVEWIGVCYSPRTRDIYPVTDPPDFWKTVDDIGPLAAFTELSGLGLSESSVQDLTPLAELKNLRWVRLNDMPIDDISSLKGSEKLRQLDLSNSNVKNIVALGDIESLWSLSLNNTGIKDLSPLSSADNLTSLHLEGTLVRDLSPLRSLKKTLFTYPA